jgi:uncharacterized protein YdhG (YjbR/CyaY superfamily)
MPATDQVRRQPGDELKPHLAGKVTVRFDAAEPLPLELVRRIVRERLAEAGS